MHINQLISISLATCTAAVLLQACVSSAEKTESASTLPAAESQQELVQRGSYLVLVGGCNDCHTPKKMTEKGPEPDMTLALSGHPAGSKLPPYEKKALQAGSWVLLSPDLTAASGPWGVSFAANLTSDSLTGIGGWQLENFIGAMRKGKHMGLDNARPIMPPMPWQTVGKLPDDDLKAIFAYLKTVPAVHNRVPAPMAPPEVLAVAK